MRDLRAQPSARRGGRSAPSRRRRAPAPGVLVGLLLALCARALVPDGFMVGSLANGWPIVPCPEDFPSVPFSRSGAAASSDDHGMHRHGPQVVAARADAAGHGAAAVHDVDANASRDVDANGSHDGHDGPGSDVVAQHCPWGGAIDKTLGLAAADAAPTRPLASIDLPPSAPAHRAARRLRGPAAPRAPPLA